MIRLISILLVLLLLSSPLYAKRRNAVDDEFVAAATVSGDSGIDGILVGDTQAIESGGKQRVLSRAKIGRPEVVIKYWYYVFHTAIHYGHMSYTIFLAVHHEGIRTTSCRLEVATYS